MIDEEYPPADQVVPDQRPLPPPVGREGLRLGDEGPGVIALQIRLGCPGTGVYDAVTEYAVRRFQVEANLTADGVADEAVHGRLGVPWQMHA